jgi:hypothetical protein
MIALGRFGSLAAHLRDFLEMILDEDPARCATSAELLAHPIMRAVEQLQADLQDPVLRYRFIAACITCFARLHPGVDSSAMAAQLYRDYVPELDQQQLAAEREQHPVDPKKHYALFTVEADAQQVLDEQGLDSRAHQLLRQQVVKPAAGGTAAGDSEPPAKLEKLHPVLPQQAQLFGVALLAAGDELPGPGLQAIVLEAGDWQGPGVRVALPTVTGEFQVPQQEQPAEQQPMEEQQD